MEGLNYRLGDRSVLICLVRGKEVSPVVAGTRVVNVVDVEGCAAKCFLGWIAL